MEPAAFETSSQTGEGEEAPLAAAATDPEGVASGPSGYVFLCRNATQMECLENRVFALSEPELERMQSNIQEGSSLFLLNMNSGVLIGSFFPNGAPALNLEPHLFEGAFPAQVRVVPAVEDEPLQAIKLDQRMPAGPKTPEEVVALQRLLSEGPVVDPFNVDENDKKYGQSFPRGKGTRFFKGKGKGKEKAWSYDMYGKGGRSMAALWWMSYGNKGRGRNQVDESGGVVGEFTGTIKSFSDYKWYGFISCPEITAMGHQDVFLHGDQKRGYRIGHTVKFTAVLNKDGKVQAKDVKSGLK